MPRNTPFSAFFQRKTQNHRRRLEDDIRGMSKIFWTTHSKLKMRYYRLSEKRVLRVLKKPDRKEEGIVEGTIANMQISGTKKRPSEIWVMYIVLKHSKGINPHTKRALDAFGVKFSEAGARYGAGVKIISAWRYPGRTPKGQRPIIPDDILRDILKEHVI